VIVSKFSDDLPLYRQSEIYARQGVEISRSTLAGWVGGASDLLDPLVDAIQKHVLSGGKLHADDTPMPVLAPGNGKTKTGRLWTYVRDDRPAGDPSAPAVWFAYSADRKGEHPRQHLKTFEGALQADAYAGFHHLLWRTHLRSGVLGACATQVPRDPMSSMHLQPPQARWPGSELSMRSRRRYAASQPIFG
jgi:transposase